MDMCPADDFREVAIKNAGEQAFSAEQIGWRFALGTVLIIAGYGAWSLIPVVIEADLEPSMKAALSGLFGATPFLTKVVAVALMGRPAYSFLKRTTIQYLRRPPAAPRNRRAATSAPSEIRESELPGASVGRPLSRMDSEAGSGLNRPGPCTLLLGEVLT